MAFDEQLAARIRQSFSASRVRFEEKRMMGGLCFLVDGKMCVGVEKDRLMARIDPAIYDGLLKQTGCAPMDFTGRPLRGFVYVNLDGLRAAADLKRWLGLALEFNPKAKRSKKKSAQGASAPANAAAKTILRRQPR